MSVRRKTMNAVTAAGFHLMRDMRIGSAIIHTAFRPRQRLSVVQCLMAEDTDLLPWILGGTLALGAVAATAVGLSDPTAVRRPRPLLRRRAPRSRRERDIRRALLPHPPTSRPWSYRRRSATAAAGTGVGMRRRRPAGFFRHTVRRSCHGTPADRAQRDRFEHGVCAALRRGPMAIPVPGPGPGYYPQPEPASDAPPDDSDAGYPVYTGTPVIVARDRWRRDRDQLGSSRQPSAPASRAAVTPRPRAKTRVNSSRSAGLDELFESKLLSNPPTMAPPTWSAICAPGLQMAPHPRRTFPPARFATPPSRIFRSSRPPCSSGTRRSA
jgi:hypothetical protein